MQCFELFQLNIGQKLVQQEDCEITSISVWSLIILCTGFLWLWFPPTHQKHTLRLIGEAKMPIGVNRSQRLIDG